MKKKGKKLLAYQKEYDRIKRQVRQAESTIYIDKEAKMLDNTHSIKLKKALNIMETIGRTPERVTAEDIRTLQGASTLNIKSSYGWEREHHKFKYSSTGDKEYLYNEDGTPVIENKITNIRKKEEAQKKYKAKLYYEKKKTYAPQGFTSDEEVSAYWGEQELKDTISDDIDALLGEEPKEEPQGKILSYADVLIQNYIDSTGGTLEQIKDSRSNVEWAQWTSDLMDYVREICIELIKTAQGKRWLAEQIQLMNVPVIVWGDSVEWTTKIAKMNYFLENAKAIETLHGPEWSKKMAEMTKKINEKLDEASYQREVGIERGDYE